MMDFQPIRRVGRYAPAMVLAVLGNYFLTGEWISRSREMSSHFWGGSQTAGAWCVLLAVILAAWAFGSGDDFKLTDSTSASAPPRTKLPGWKAFLPCLVFYLAGLLIYLVAGEGPLMRWCWVLGVVSLVVPLLRHFDWRDFWPLPFWEYILLVLILAGAFTARYVDLTELPLHVDNDVAIMGLFSRKLVLAENWRWVGMAPTNHQYSEHQFLAMSMRLFGTDHYGLVMLSVLAGTATTMVLYFTGKVLFNRWVGFLAAAFLAFNYVHIHFSRIIFGSLTTFFVLLAGLFLLHGLRRVSLLSFAISGISLGMGMLDYYSGRVGPVIGFSMFLLWWLRRRKHPEIRLTHWLALLAGLLLAFGPNLLYGLRESEKFVGRGSEVMIWTKSAWRHLSGKYESHGNAAIVWKEQIQRTLLAPFYYPDESTICHLRKPMLGVLTALCFMLGLGFCLRRGRDPACFYPLVFIGLTFLFGGILTIDPPFWPHLNIAVPAMALVAAIGAERLTHRLMLVFPGRSEVVVPMVLMTGMLFTAIQNWETYYQFARRHAGGRITAVRLIEKLQPDYRVFLISRDIKWEQEAFQFFTPHVEGRNLKEADLFQNLPKIDRPTVFFIFEDADRKCVDFLIQSFPWATRRAYLDGWQWEVFTVIRVLPQGYVEYPQDLRPPVSIWNQPGWRYVLIVLIGILALGGVVLHRDLKKEALPL